MLRCFSTLKGAAPSVGVTLPAVYLFVWHGAHVAVALPFLLLLACPLIHVFMHGGHGPHHGAVKHDSDVAKGNSFQPKQSPAPDT